MEAWTTIRYLHAQGTPIRAICRELGVSRNTVRQALRDDSVTGKLHEVAIPMTRIRRRIERTIADWACFRAGTAVT